MEDHDCTWLHWWSGLDTGTLAGGVSARRRAVLAVSVVCGASVFGVSRCCVEGVLRAVRADDTGRVLFEPVVGPLPQAQPGKRFRDRRRYPQLASNMSNEVQYEA